MVKRIVQQTPSHINETKVSQAVPHLKAEPVAASGPIDRAHAAFVAAGDNLLAELGAPGWKRATCAVIAGLAVGLGLGWCVVQVCLFLMVGAVIGTGSMFIAYALGALAAVYLAWKAGKATARVFGAVLTGEVDERARDAYTAAGAFVRSLNPFARQIVVAE